MPPCGSSFFPSTPRAFAETSLYLIILSNVHLGSPPAVPPPPPLPCRPVVVCRRLPSLNFLFIHFALLKFLCRYGFIVVHLDC